MRQDSKVGEGRSRLRGRYLLWVLALVVVGFGVRWIRQVAFPAGQPSDAVLKEQAREALATIEAEVAALDREKLISLPTPEEHRGLIPEASKAKIR